MFREDVIGVARNREPDVRLAGIAKDFGISELCLTSWLAAADVVAGTEPGVTAADNAELRAATRRIRLLEQENEVVRRTAAHLSQANLPENDVPARRPRHHRRQDRRRL